MKFVISFFVYMSDTVNKLVEFVVVLLMVFLSVLMVLAVFFRYVLNSSIYWSDEVSKILLVFIAFLGSTVAYKHSAHIGIDVFAEKLPDFGKRLLNTVIKLSFFGFWLLILIESIKMIPIFLMQKMATLEIPYGYIFSILPIVASVWIIHLTKDILVSNFKKP